MFSDDRGIGDVQLGEFVGEGFEVGFNLDCGELRCEERDHAEGAVKDAEVGVDPCVGHGHERLEVDLDGGPVGFEIGRGKVKGDRGDGDIRVGLDDD